LSKLVKKFDEIKLTHIGRDKNQIVYVLAILAFMAKIDYGNRVQPISTEVRDSLAPYCLVKGEVDGNSWYYDIK
jgi:hypothetical protein